MAELLKEAVIGLDIGQGREHSAICVVEAELREAREKCLVHFDVRHLERRPVRSSFPELAERLAELAKAVWKQISRWPMVYTDLTGLRAPVLEILRDSDVWVEPGYFTHGDRRTQEGERDEVSYTLGKAYLVSRLQALLQTGRLHLPKTPEAGSLGEELLAYQVKVEENANDRYGAFRVGARDDLVTAVGLAVQVDPVFRTSRGDAGIQLSEPRYTYEEMCRLIGGG
ncbi:MAG: hypothetical protein KDD47_16955 [Acidobacteria bacterium]|nr:hypothetical protein [Acidobacteriota bacterium]